MEENNKHMIKTFIHFVHSYGVFFSIVTVYLYAVCWREVKKRCYWNVKHGSQTKPPSFWNCL